jgi:hypothetical protein
LLSWHPKRLHSLRQRQSTSTAVNSEAEAQNDVLVLFGMNGEARTAGAKRSSPINRGLQFFALAVQYGPLDVAQIDWAAHPPRPRRA